jgi:intracellular multiplication protein IcmO
VAIARQIVGPQAQFERSGAQSLRDIRPLTTRLSEGLRGSGSFLVLVSAAVATWFEPAIIDLAVPASLLYATWVLTRRPSLPIRLPRSADCLD